MPVFHKGQRVGSGPDSDRWVVLRKIGEGTFAEVWEVRDSHADGDTRFAIKVDKRLEVRSVKAEYKVMTRVSEQCPQICQVVGGGQLVSEPRWYVVMQLLGANLVEFRRTAQGSRLGPRVLRQVAGSMLDCIQAVHESGYIHRDIKPANFGIILGSNTDGGGGQWRLLDFGLARRYLDDSGAVAPARPDAAFRGSTTYASVHAHQGHDQGRRDDLWSWMYCMVELAEGTLPWRQLELVREGDGAAYEAQKTAIAAVKQAAIDNPGRLTRLPAMTGVVDAISQHLGSLGFADTPDYGALRRALAAIPDDWPAADQRLQPAATAPLTANIDLTQHPTHTGSAAAGTSATQPPTPAWCMAPPENSREAAAVSNMKEYVTWVQEGVGGPTVERLVAELCALHPADSLAAIAAVLGAAVVSTPAKSCNGLAALLSDVAAYAGHASQQAAARFVQWEQEEAQRKREMERQYQLLLEQQQQEYMRQVQLQCQQVAGGPGLGAGAAAQAPLSGHTETRPMQRADTLPPPPPPPDMAWQPPPPHTVSSHPEVPPLPPLPLPLPPHIAAAGWTAHEQHAWPPSYHGVWPNGNA